jgi:predicted dehydrogenase
MAKPVATDVPGTLKIAEAAKQATASQKVFLVDFQARTSPFFMEAISRVHRGDIGSLGMVIVRCASDNWTDAPKTKTIADRLHDLIWVHDTELGGGYICNYDIHAMDVALWMARATPVSAMGYSQKLDPTLSGDSPEIYSLSYQFEKELILSHHGEHLRNTNPWLLRVDGCGDKGYMESDYYTKVWIHSNKQSYRGGEVPNLYKEGMQANVDTFYRSVIEGSHTNPTVQPALDANFATILGREASSRNGLLTMKDLLRENKKLEVDYHGLID